MSRLIHLAHLMGATKNSLAGLARAWKGEQAFRHEVLLLPFLALLLLLTGKSAGDWLLVLGGWIAVMVVELLNSAIEEAFDLISRDWNSQIKAGKDMASAAIFLTMLINAGLWLYVFFLS
ncbi:MAG: diacylglycerol kinase [Bilophila sp.]